MTINIINTHLNYENTELHKIGQLKFATNMYLALNILLLASRFRITTVSTT